MRILRSRARDRESEYECEGRNLRSGERSMATVTVTAVITGQRCEQDRTRLPTVGQNLIKIMMRGKMRVCVCFEEGVCASGSESICI